MKSRRFTLDRNPSSVSIKSKTQWGVCITNTIPAAAPRANIEIVAAHATNPVNFETMLCGRIFYKNKEVRDVLVVKK